MQLQAGQTAAVTGAASGIGLALAAGFARRGLNVVLADVDEGGLEAGTSLVQALGVEAYGQRCDVASAEDVDRLATSRSNGFPEST